MNEQDFLTSNDPQAMLRYLESGRAGAESAGATYPLKPCPVSVSDRKLGLFVTAVDCIRCFEAIKDMTVAEAAAFVAGASCGTQADKAAMLREIVGNPWKPVTLPKNRQVIDHKQRTADDDVEVITSDLICPWLTPPVLALARSAYETRDFAALPVLWDALSEAGCQEEQIRRHCAEPLHVQGCWLIDLLLGKD